MPNLQINDRSVTVPKGLTVLEVAREAAITIPTLCYHRDLPVAGSCRLCLVEIEQMAHMMPACATPAHDGMIIRTETPALTKMRRLILQLLLRHYVDDQDAIDEGDQTEFLHWVRYYEVESHPGVPAPRFVPNADPNPFV